MTETISEFRYRYQVRFFPPIAQGQKFYFKNQIEAENFILNAYESLSLDKLPSEDIEKWKKNLFEEFINRIHVVQIDKELCPNHEKLFF